MEETLPCPEEEEQLIGLARKAYQIPVVRGHSHELNNLLTGILGHAQLIIETFDLSESLLDQMKEIETSAQRSRETIRHMTALWNPPEQDSVNIKKFLKDIVSSLKYHTDRNRIRISHESPCESALLHISCEDLQDLLYTLLLSIIDKVPAKTSIIIRTKKEQRGYRISLDTRESGSEAAGKLSNYCEMLNEEKNFEVIDKIIKRVGGSIELDEAQRIHLLLPLKR